MVLGFVALASSASAEREEYLPRLKSSHDFKINHNDEQNDDYTRWSQKTPSQDIGMATNSIFKKEASLAT